MCFGVGSANTPGNDNTEKSGNSLKERLANIFTPNDNMEYQDGVLMNTSQGKDNSTKVPYKAGAFYDIPDKSNINVTNTNRDDRIFDTDDIANFEKQENSLSENLANFFKPFDGAEYIGGNLIDEKTKQSLTGGGYATNKAGVKNYIYGVADDFTNNAQPKQGGMSNEDYATALKVFKRRQSQLQNIAPSNAEYITSFLPGLVSPGIGGFIGNKMLEGGINARRANMDQHQAALDGGATPEMSEDGNTYLGYNKNGTFMPYIEEPTAPVVNAEQSDGNNSKDPLLNRSLGALSGGLGDDVREYEEKVYSQQYDPDGTLADDSPASQLQIFNNMPKSTKSDEDALEDKPILYAGPIYDYFERNILPDIVRQKPDMNQDDIDEAFRIFRKQRVRGL